MKRASSENHYNDGVYNYIVFDILYNEGQMNTNQCLCVCPFSCLGNRTVLCAESSVLDLGQLWGHSSWAGWL